MSTKKQIVSTVVSSSPLKRIIEELSLSLHKPNSLFIKKGTVPGTQSDVSN